MKNSTFKMRGSPFQRNFGIGSPMKDEETKSKIERGETTVEITEEGDIYKDRTDIETTTTTVPGITPEKIAKPGTKEYDRWLEAVKKDPSIEDKYKDKTVTETKEVPVEEIIEAETRTARSRYEMPNIVRSDQTHTSVNVDGKVLRIPHSEMPAWYEGEGYNLVKGGSFGRGKYVRQSTSGKGQVYDQVHGTVDGKNLNEMIGQKPDFDYSTVDYGDTGEIMFSDAKERDDYYTYQKELAEAQRQIKHDSEKETK